MQRLTTTKMRSVNSYPFSTRKRVFDITLAVFASIVLIIPIILLALCVKLTSSGPVFFSSDRVGQNNVIFRMVKFRTMREGTQTGLPHWAVLCGAPVWMNFRNC